MSNTFLVKIRFVWKFLLVPDCLCQCCFQRENSPWIVSFFSTWIDLTWVYLSNLRMFFCSFDFTHKTLTKWPRYENKLRKKTFFNFDTRFAFLVCFSHSLLCIVAMLVAQYRMKRYHNNVYACSTFRPIRMRAKTYAIVWVWIWSMLGATETKIRARQSCAHITPHHTTVSLTPFVYALRWYLHSHGLRSRKIVHQHLDGGRCL